jgi:predicted Zn-dependent protease
MAAVLPSWGYNYTTTYANPYYVESPTPVYDYSQPIVINTYNTPTSDATSTASPEQSTTVTQDTAATTEGYATFDAARAAFAKDDFSQALQLVEKAIQSVPNDPVLHEFGALCLFAQGDYKRAAAVLNAVLAVAPGMDWTTMSGLYSDVDTYTQQLRKLEAATNDNPDDAAARFVLAYHYMIVGHTDEAIEELKVVVAKQPGDQVAKRMLDALQPPAEEAPKTEPAAEGTTPETPAEGEGGTDLIGAWKAERDGTVFELKVDDQGDFAWKVTPKDGKAVEISGPIAATSDTLVLESKDQGTMVGKVKSNGPDEFQFLISGSPPDDPGLTFKRVK